MATRLPPPAEPPRIRRPLAVWLAGRIAWDGYAALAERLAWEVSEPRGRPPTLVLGELTPSITIGRLGSRADVDLSDEELRSLGLEIRFVGRGGGAVLHAPGQMIVALFAAVEDLGLGRHDVGGYVERFQNGLAGALRRLGCDPCRRESAHGLFGRTGLLAAVGIAVRRGVACHGGFVNVCPALEVFQRIGTAVMPPGGASPPSPAVAMGSVESELRRKIRIPDARTAVVEQFAAAFAFPATQIHAGFPFPVPLAHQLERLGRVG